MRQDKLMVREQVLLWKVMKQKKEKPKNNEVGATICTMYNNWIQLQDQKHWHTKIGKVQLDLFIKKYTGKYAQNID